MNRTFSLVTLPVGKRRALAWIPWLAAWVFASGATAAALPPEQVEFFEKKIRPVLVAECVDCHNAEKQKGGLRLDYRDGWKKGGDSGESILPGNPAESLLMISIRHEDPDLKMPSKAPKLDATVIADFEAWIKMGAPDPRDEPPKHDGAPSKWADLLEARRLWWSFQPVREVAIPTSKSAAEDSHPVDRFLRAAMEQHGLSPTEPATPTAILRRLSFALTGLPPTPEQTARFSSACALDAQSAVGQAADEFLASERFGEHWARHWMDLVRYSESHGSEMDTELPVAWRYRDYLVRALNSDVPLDALIREHLAGDLLPKPRLSPDGLNESSIGPAHFRMVEHGDNAVDTREAQVRVLDNQIDVVTKAFQGLTVACARCHDHKFDAVSQRDYYALQGIFACCHQGQITVDAPGFLKKNQPTLEQLHEKIRAALAEQWLSAAENFPERLAQEPTEEGDWKQALMDAQREPTSPLRAWVALATAGDDFDRAWESFRATNEQAIAAIRETNAKNFRKGWDFRQGEAAGWIRSGAGLEQKLEAGMFSILPVGDRILSQLYPPALLTHSLSTKSPGVLISPTFKIKTGRISIRAFGSGGLGRLIADNYAVANRFNAKVVLNSDDDQWIILATKSCQTRTDARGAWRGWNSPRAMTHPSGRWN